MTVRKVKGGSGGGGGGGEVKVGDIICSIIIVIPQSHNAGLDFILLVDSVSVYLYQYNSVLIPSLESEMQKKGISLLFTAAATLSCTFLRA